MAISSETEGFGLFQEKENTIKEQETTLQLLSQDATQESFRVTTADSSDWDDPWAVPDESFVENSSPLHSSKACEEHLQEIESLQEEVSKCNSEIKELKILLRLSPPESLVDNNNRRDSLHSIPEPTEFEYLKNIIYEYMMGKEPITLVKVIAAVLRFSDVQTQQVIRREETRHHTIMLEQEVPSSCNYSRIKQRLHFEPSPIGQEHPTFL